MSKWRTITDPRNSTEIELYSQLGIKLLEYYEKRQLIMKTKKNYKKSVKWDKIVNPISMRKVLLTGDKGSEVLTEYRNYLDNRHRREKKKRANLKKRDNILRIKKQFKKAPIQKQHFSNPYLVKSQKLCSITEKSIDKFKRKNKIIIKAPLLKQLGYKLKGAVNITIPNFTKDGPTINILEEYFKVFCEIYQRLASEKVTRKDFFTNPGTRTINNLRMFNGIRTKLIQYFFSFLGGGGGTKETGHFDVDNHNVDDFVNMLETMSGIAPAPTGISSSVIYIPEVPTTRPQRGETRIMMTP